MVTDKNFQCKITKCGTDINNYNYDILKLDNAVDLMLASIDTISHDLVGDNSKQVLIHLTCMKLLKQIRTDFDILFPAYNKKHIKEIYDKFSISTYNK